MRIAVIISTFPPYRGGMGNVAETEARLLAQAGHEVTVLTPGCAAAEDAGQPFRVERLCTWFGVGNAAIVPQLVWRARNFDAVHLHYPFLGGAEWLAIGRLLGLVKNYSLTYHMDLMGRGVRGGLFKIYSWLVLPLVLRQAKAVLVSSRDYAETSPLFKPHLTRLGDRLHVVPFAIGGESVARAVLPVSGRDKNFIFVGGLDSAHYFKGLSVLIRAWELARPRLVGFTLKIVGDGNLRAGLERSVQERDFSEISFLGSLPPGPALRELLAKSRALIFPSLDRSEAFGLAALEAMAMGTPVVASDLAGVRTLVTDEVGRRFPVADVAALALNLIELAEQNTEVERLGRAAWMSVKERYTDTQLAKNLLTLL